ncbi:hypothetical protein ABT010_38285 [Streptomyces sp. NPDC002668]|uniref:hypothetical protein n=1 Tax=Streptomyces sp. NPDC002668 TaxID=3154422 RepID=UPI00332E053B
MNYDGRIPVLATTLERLQTKGLQGETWWRYGRDTWQPLTEALDNPDGQEHTYRAHQHARWEAESQEEERRGARKPSGGGSGKRRKPKPRSWKPAVRSGCSSPWRSSMNWTD